MKSAISLMYHDVVPDGRPDESGFPSADAGLYKLTVDAFRSHLKAVQACAGSNVDHTANIGDWGGRRPVLFTFDDGGLSSLHPTAELLEEFGWRGHFFIATDFIATTGFLSREEIRELAARGHVSRLALLLTPDAYVGVSRDQLLREWSESIARLSDITGVEVITGSVPGGWFSAAVAETAAQSGLRVLFNSEPQTRITCVEGDGRARPVRYPIAHNRFRMCGFGLGIGIAGISSEGALGH